MVSPPRFAMVNRPGTGHITLALVDQSIAGRLFKGWIFGHRIGLETDWNHRGFLGKIHVETLISWAKSTVETMVF